MNTYCEAVTEYTTLVDKHGRYRLLARPKLARRELLNYTKIGKENIKEYQDLSG